MLLYEPPPTQADVHFRVLGIPVRVHPYFWLTTLLLGLNTDGGTPPAELVGWAAVVFVSILVHELGHALTQRWYGGRPWITLHGIGGLASCDDCDRRPLSQIVISLAGPAAGFALAAVVVLAVRLSGHAIGWTWGSKIPWAAAGVDEVFAISLLGGRFYWEPLGSSRANMLLADALTVNILWGLINLLPVYPLDGGRVMRELCTLRRPRQGLVLSLQISFATAAIMAVIAVVSWKSLFTGILFGYLAYSSYRTLTAYQASRW